MKKELQTTLPNTNEIRIVGENYPIPPVRAMIANVFSTCFMVSLALSLFGGQLSFLPPAVRDFVSERRGALVGAGAVMSLVARSIQQTGAFEIFVDGTLVFSKLESGGAPSVETARRLILEATLLKDFDEPPTTSS